MLFIHDAQGCKAPKDECIVFKKNVADLLNSQVFRCQACSGSKGMHKNLKKDSFVEALPLLLPWAEELSNYVPTSTTMRPT